MEFNEFLKAVSLGLTLMLPLANPLTSVVLMLSLAGDVSGSEKRRIARSTALYSLGIMLVAYYAGNLVMSTFGISIPGLRIAGGLIVSFIGFQMLFPAHPLEKIVGPEPSDKEQQVHDIAFVPLAMPGFAGPGTIAMIISATSTIQSESVHLPGWILIVAPPVVFALLCLLLWASLRCSGGIMRFFGKSGIEAVSRIMGFFLVCIGVQFLINGVLEIVNAYPNIQS